MHRLLWCAAGLAVASLPLVAAHAAGKPAPREGSLGNAASDAPILTREQLRVCLNQQEVLQKETAAVLEQQRALDDERGDIARRKSELDDALATLDRTGQPAVDAHNARAQEVDARIDAWNARRGPVNARAEALNAQKQGFQRDCANRRYREDDLILLKARK